jgi:hypothetical protein
VIEIKRTESGWCGHFICARDCLFRRNTLLERPDGVRIVVSTVGAMQDRNEKGFQTIGHNRYFETMCFHAKNNYGYWDADVNYTVPFVSQWAIRHIDRETDGQANAMHDAVVKEISERMAAGEAFEKIN